MARRIEMENESQWLEARKNTIGASESASVVGLNKYKSSYELWLDKTGQGEPFEGNEKMDWGNRLEPAILQAFNDRGYPAAYLNGKTLYLHDEHAFISCTPDGILEDGSGGVEIKTASGFGVNAWADGVPVHYWVQVQHQIAVMGWSRAFVAVLFNGAEMQVFSIERDSVFIESLIDSLVEFWAAVKTLIPPQVDASTSSLALDITATDDPPVELGEDIEPLFVERAEIAKQLEALETRKSLIDNLIKEQLKGAQKGNINGVLAVTWKPQTRTSLDSKTLKIDMPEIVSKYTKPSTFRVLKFI